MKFAKIISGNPKELCPYCKHKTPHEAGHCKVKGCKCKDVAKWMMGGALKENTQ